MPGQVEAEPARAAAERRAGGADVTHGIADDAIVARRGVSATFGSFHGMNAMENLAGGWTENGERHDLQQPGGGQVEIDDGNVPIHYECGEG
jgi:hypothetical protein